MTRTATGTGQPTPPGSNTGTHDPAARSTGRSTRAAALPALADQPIAEHLPGPPPPTPAPSETPHDRLRRTLIDQPGIWIVLNTRTPLREATARRLARSYQHAKPSRLNPAADGRFHARPYLRDGTWHVAATYQPHTPPAGAAGPD